jgi:hypothetical protein
MNGGMSAIGALSRHFNLSRECPLWGADMTIALQNVR